jgi:undecaprenyl-diphosphatase
LTDFRLPLDEPLFRAVNQLQVGWLDALFVLASSRVFGGVLLGAFGLLLLGRYRRRALPALLQLGVAVALTDQLGARVWKPLVGRLRPSFALPPEAVRVLAPAANVGSMPSLHAANAFAAATVVALLVPRAGWVTLPLATLIAVSRVGVGVHWPSDVVVGAVYGSLLAWAVVVLVRWRWPAARLTPAQAGSGSPSA